MRSFKYLVLIVLAVSVPVFADSISIGYLSILSDSPTGGEQEISVFNETGSNCYTSYTACTNLSFTNWTLTVNYTSSYYNGSGPKEPAPLVYTDTGSSPFGGFGDITPSSTNNVFDLDLCGGAGSCATPVTTVTSVVFSGTLSQSSFCLYDATVPGCNPTSPTTFFANPNFTMTWDGSSSGGSPYVDESSTQYAQSPDITVSNVVSPPPPPPSTPEPASFLLAAGLLPVVLRLARRKV